MGHYLREMCDETEDDRVFNRTLKLRDKYCKLKLSKFLVEDLPLLVKLMKADLNDSELKVLQNKLSTK